MVIGKRGVLRVLMSVFFPMHALYSFLFFSVTTKKGAAAWLSWVLIISFSVGLGAFMFRWMTGFTQSTADKLADKVEESDCELIGVSVLDSCQTVEELKLELQNKKNLNVDQILINYIDIYDNPGTKVLNYSLRVNKKEKINILKQGIIKQFELIPRAFREDKIIVCNENTVVLTDIRHCRSGDIN